MRVRVRVRAVQPDAREEAERCAADEVWRNAEGGARAGAVGGGGSAAVVAPAAVRGGAAGGGAGATAGAGTRSASGTASATFAAAAAPTSALFQVGVDVLVPLFYDFCF